MNNLHSVWHLHLAHRVHHYKVHVRHHHLVHQAYVGAAVPSNGNYFAAKDGSDYVKVICAKGHFFDLSHGHRSIVRVKRFHGHPLVWVNSHLYGSNNGRNYFGVREDLHGHVRCISNLSLHETLNLVNEHYLAHRVHHKHYHGCSCWCPSSSQSSSP